MLDFDLDLEQEIREFNELLGHRWPKGIAEGLAEELGLDVESIYKNRLDFLLQDIREEA